MRSSRTVLPLLLAAAGVAALAGCSSSGGGGAGPALTSAASAPGSAASTPVLGPTVPSIAPGTTADVSRGSTSAPPATVGPSAPFPTPSNGRGAGTETDQAGVLNALPGRTSPGCVSVGARATDVRSGSVAAGNFATARHSYASGTHTVFLYLIPQHAKGLHRATITLTPRSGGSPATITSTQVDQAAQWQYFSVDLPVPAPGAYRLTMAAGSDHGCFDVTFAH